MSEEATLDEFATETEPEEGENTLRLGPNQVEIPDLWEVSTFEGVNNPDKPIGYGVVKPGEDIDDGIPLVKIEDVVDGYLSADQEFHQITEEKDEKYSRSRLSGGEILVSIQGTVGDAVIVPPEMEGSNISRTIARVSPDQPNNLWIKYYIESKSLQDYIQIVSSGSTRASYNIGDIRKTNVALPPLPEQRKIATILYMVDRAIEKTEEIIEQTHTVKKALTQDVFHGRHKDFKDYRTTPVGEIPIHWSVSSIGDVVHTAQYGISESLSEEGQYPIFRMNNIVNGKMVDEPLKYIDLEDDEFEKYRVKKGDVLFNRTNSLELVGKTGIYELKGDHVFASYLVRLQTNAKADSHYLNYYMNSSEAQNRMMDFATKGVSQANINANSIQQVKLPLPPVEEQKEVVARLNSIDSQIKSNEQYKSQLKRLKRGLMQDLLSGTVRTTDTKIEVPEEVAQHG